MKAIWEAVSQAFPDGQKKIIWRNANDLQYLYETGFVDTDQFSLEQWTKAFEESRQPNGSYLVTEEQWLAKRSYRYNGPTGEPFDPLSMREGEWTPEEIEDLIANRLLPSTILKRESFDQMLAKGREMGRFINGKYIINKPFKFGLKQLLDFYPSPKRQRELAVQEARKKLKATKETASVSKQEVPTTGFATGPSKEKQMTDQLSKLLWKGK